jgi:ABC-type branched-subunit amino acid transport system substrate-binding protein
VDRLRAWLAATFLLAACGPTTVSAPPPGQQAATSIPPVVEQAPARIAPGAQPVEPAEPLAPELPPGPVALALLVPLSGERQALGRDLFDAATLALFDVARDDIVVLPKDTGGTPAGASAAATEALAEGARLIIGPLFAAEAGAVAPMASAAGVPVIAFSSDRRVAAPGVYVFGLAPEDQIDRAVAFALSQGRMRFAALVPDNDAGHVMARAVAKSVTERGGLLARPGFYGPAEGDATSEVRAFADFATRASALSDQYAALEGRTDEAAVAARARLEQAAAFGQLGYDTVVLPLGGQRLRSIVALLPFFDVGPPDVQVIGTAAWDEPSTLAEPGLAGGWFAAPDANLRASFARRFQASFGRDPSPIASLAYDAVALAGVLVATAPASPFAEARLVGPSGFAGVDGIFRFFPDGTSQRGLAMFQVVGGKAEMIAPAASSFELLGQ